MDDDVDDQRRQAEQAARDAYRRWEHCEPPYDNFRDISYPLFGATSYTRPVRRRYDAGRAYARSRIGGG
jgi:hypothetical protein